MKETIRNMDWLLFASVTGLAAVGLYALNMDSAQSLPRLWQHQSGFVVAGMLGFLLFSSIPLRMMTRMSWPLYAVALLLLMLVLPFGEEHNGAIRWFDLGSVNVPPAEIMKWSLMLVFVRWFATKDTTTIVGWGVPLLSLILPMFLLFQQPDIGEAILLLLIAIIIAIAAKQWRVLAWLMASGAGFLAFIWFVVMHHPYQKNRLMGYVSANFDSEAGYGILQSGHAWDIGTAVTALALVFAVVLIVRLLMLTYQARNHTFFPVCVGISTMVTMFIMLNIGIFSGFLHANMPLRPLITYNELALVLMMAAVGLVMRAAIECHEQ